MLVSVLLSTSYIYIFIFADHVFTQILIKAMQFYHVCFKIYFCCIDDTNTAGEVILLCVHDLLFIGILI